ncbi:MAG: hypothetical protein V5A64_04725 [Candidatus Thermoplasmatota archaeon]
MAKRREEKDEKEDKGFTPPKFNKEEFIQEQKRNIKSYFVSFLLGLAIAFISAVFWISLSGNNLRLPLIIIFGIFAGSWLKYAFTKIGLDVSEFDKKNWLGSYAIYFFSWLVILIILINPPVYDAEPPSVNMVVLPDSQEIGGDVFIVAKITDNAGFDKEDITLTIGDEKINDFEFKDNVLRYHFKPDNLSKATTYNYSLVVKDHSGQKTEKKSSFSFSNDTIYLASHENAYTSSGPEVYSGTSINFKVNSENVDQVYYTVNGGKKINMTKQDEYYVTYPKYKGWPQNENVTVRVYAKSVHYFKIATSLQKNEWDKLNPEEFNNTIVDSQEYYFQVGEQNIGTEDPPGYTKEDPKIVQVPGFETVVFLISLIALALLIRYKKKHKK